MLLDISQKYSALIHFNRNILKSPFTLTSAFQFSTKFTKNPVKVRAEKTGGEDLDQSMHEGFTGNDAFT